MRFNLITKIKEMANTTINHQGAKAFVMSPEFELYSAVATTGLSNTSYEKADQRLDRIIALMDNCSLEFIAKLAIYTRTQMHLRTISIVLLVHLAKKSAGKFALANVIPKVVLRADEITELLAYYQIANDRKGVKMLNKLSKQVQKGLAITFNQFDEYQFAKYNRDGAVKLKDALFLIHPKAKDKLQQNIFNKIATDSLATPNTWETELSALGQQKFENDKAKAHALKVKWEELIASNKLGYMALLRNLRNILQANVSADAINMVGEYLCNEKAVINSKQLPFRFLSAYREVLQLNVNYTSYIIECLEKAVSISSNNIKGFGLETSVLIACDVSGSMQQSVSAKSKILLYDIGLILGMMLKSKCKNVTTGMFGDTWKSIPMSSRDILSNVQAFYKREGEVGYSTNGYLVIDNLLTTKKIVDKVMLFTDVQMYDSRNFSGSLENSWNKYKAMAPHAKLYVFDLAGYGHAPLNIKRNDVHLIAGWSDKIFDILACLEEGENAIQKINAIAV
jgi:60 kDa SS-A/Ro ribonucleoprotein